MNNNNDNKHHNLIILPEDVWEFVATNLSPKDVFSLLCVNHSMHNGLGRSITLWKTLIERDNNNNNNNGNPIDSIEFSCYSNNDSEQEQQQQEQHKILRHIYRTIAYKNELPSVKWYPVQLTRTGNVNISGREGHLVLCNEKL